MTNTSTSAISATRGELLGSVGAFRAFKFPAETVMNRRGEPVELPERVEFVTGAILKNIGNNELENTNGGKFKVNQVEVDMASGKGIYNAMCYEGNYNTLVRKDPTNTEPMSVGTSYLTRMTVDPKGTPRFTVSHLPSGANIKKSDVIALYEALNLDVSSLIGDSGTPAVEAQAKQVAEEATTQN